jgi:aminopeptidase N
MSMLARMRTCVLIYVTEGMRAQTHDDVAAKLVALAMGADPGSDQQLQYFLAFAGLACNPTQWEFVEEVLNGVFEVPGLVVDTDVRWQLLTDLVAAGRRGETEIGAELARDDTLSGLENAEGARAAIPTFEAKKRAWDRGVLDETVTNATQRNILASFMKVKDPVLLREFAVEYFAQIEKTWTTRTNEMAKNIVQMMYPLRSVNDPEIDVLAMTDAWLDELGSRLPALRRLVLACREEVICARMAQKADATV